MDMIKIYILSIIVAMTFGWAKESHAQVAYRDDSYYTSLMSTTFNNGSASLLSSNLIQQDNNKKRLTTFEKILNVPIGIVIGSLCGCAIGGVFPSDCSMEKLSNFIKGGLIGANVGPFYSFEIMSMSKGIKNPSHKWFFKAGGNLTVPNYDKSTLKIGDLIGIVRHYHLSNRIGLRGEVNYALRQFLLPSQKIIYGYYFDRVVKSYDIDFSVGYINTAILLNFKILSVHKFDFYVTLGPCLSLAVRDDTKFYFIKEEENPDDFDFSYIMDEPGPLFGYPAMVYQLELQLGKLIWQLGFHHSVTYTDEIYPLISKTRLLTFELSIGYKL